MYRAFQIQVCSYVQYILCAVCIQTSVSICHPKRPCQNRVRAACRAGRCSTPLSVSRPASVNNLRVFHDNNHYQLDRVITV